MFRLAVLAFMLAGCVPMQQASAPAAPLPVVPLDQRMSEATLKMEYDSCIAKELRKPKTAEWCRCVDDQMRISMSRTAYADAAAVQMRNPGNPDALLSGSPVLSAIGAECIRRVQPF